MPRPDFSGRWLNTAYESPDVEAFYRDGMKVGWMACQAAKAANYGCGKLVHTIEQDEDELKLKLTGVQGMPNVVFHQRFDGLPHKTEDGTSTYVYSWEGETLIGICIEGTGFDVARLIQEELQGDKMIVHLEFKEANVSMRRVFERQPDDPPIAQPEVHEGGAVARAHEPWAGLRPTSLYGVNGILLNFDYPAKLVEWPEESRQLSGRKLWARNGARLGTDAIAFEKFDGTSPAALDALRKASCHALAAATENGIEELFVMVFDASGTRSTRRRSARRIWSTQRPQRWRTRRPPRGCAASASRLTTRPAAS